MAENEIDRPIPNCCLTNYHKYKALLKILLLPRARCYDSVFFLIFTLYPLHQMSFTSNLIRMFRFSIQHIPLNLMGFIHCLSTVDKP